MLKIRTLLSQISSGANKAVIRLPSHFFTPNLIASIRYIVVQKASFTIEIQLKLSVANK